MLQRESEEGKLNAVTLRVAHSNGRVTKEDALEEMKDILEEKRRELLRMVLQEEGSTIPRACRKVFWKMAKVLHLIYIKDDGFTSNELLSTIKDAFEKPIALDEFSGDDAIENLNTENVERESGNVTSSF